MQSDFRIESAGEERAYGRPKPTYDPVLAEVGPGTPGGELLRRYWQPVALSHEATDLPKLIRRFGEDLILFRTRNGDAGLLYPRCMHRGTSLFYGKVEADGIRCCYHGWKYDTEGRCLDQPAEPGGGERRDRIRQPWYPVVERFGAIWTYMGPAEKQPLFPEFSHFQNLADDEEIRAIWFSDKGEIGPFPVDHNWFQFWENLVDHLHVPILHAMISGDQFTQSRMAIMPEVKWSLAPKQDSVLTAAKRDTPGKESYVRVAQAIIPNSGALPPFHRVGLTAELMYAVPFDDTTHAVIQFERQKKGTPPFDFRAVAGFGPERKLWSEMSDEEHQRAPNDYEAQWGQGPIALHSEEHLATSDIGIGMLRRFFKQQCKIVAEGGDPVGVGFGPEPPVVCVVAEAYATDTQGVALKVLAQTP